MRLTDGDNVSIQGSFKAELYTPDGGETKLSLSIIADRVLALSQAPKERKPKTPGDVPSRGGAAAFVDAIPFGAA
jgi:hypothetical protein